MAPLRDAHKAALLALTAIALAACSSSGSTPSAGSSSTSTSTSTSTSAPPPTVDATVDATAVVATVDATAVVATSEPAAGQVPVAGDADLAALVLPHVDAALAPTAMGVAVVDGDGTRVAVAGTVSVDDATPVALEARFHLGSDTKAMTAVALASVLADRGIDLSATLADVLPDIDLDPGFASVTVAELLAHRAGIVDDALTIDLPALAHLPAVEGRDAGARAILAAAPQDPTRAFSYSNAGFTIAGWISEHLTGEPWEDLVRERVFDPLGMTCGFGAPTGPDEPIGHDAAGVPDGRLDTNPEIIDPAGRVSCSMADWAAWARAALDLAEGRPSVLLPESMEAQLFEVVDGGDYVSGWLVLPRPDGATWYAHDGSNLDWLARIILDPADDRAVLLAANSAADAVSAAFDPLSLSLLAP